MSALPGESVIEIAKREIRIEDYAHGVIPNLKWRNGSRDWTACCPFHEEKTPSFHVRTREQDFKCFGCNAGGDVIDLAMRITGETNPRVMAERLLGDAGRDSQPVRRVNAPSQPEKIRSIRKATGETPVRSDEANAWLVSRGISVGVADRNGIRSDRTSLLFDYVVAGEVINEQRRGIGGKSFKFDEGADVVPFGLDDCAGRASVTIVEGVMDKLAIEEATGDVSVVAMPSANPGLRSYELLGDLAKAGVGRVVIAVDRDVHGEKLQEELVRRLGAHLCCIVTWPDDCKDANDTLLKHGSDAVRSLLDTAVPMPVEGVFTIDDSWDAIEQLYVDGLPSGISTGWPAFDRYYTGRKKQLNIITGTPGSGKSVWTDALLMNFAKGKAAWKFAICSPEMQPLERHWAHLIGLWAGKPFGTGPRERLDRETLRQAREFLRDRFFMVLPEEPTVDAVLDRLLWTHRRHGVDGWLMDPWNEMDHSRPNGMTMTEYCNIELRKTKKVLQNHDVWGGLIAHPTKLYRKKDDGKYPVPTLYDIADSAAFFNKADNGIVVWRNKEDDNDPVQVHVQKIRFAEIGGLGMQPFGYDKVTGNYRDVESFDEEF